MQTQTKKAEAGKEPLKCTFGTCKQLQAGGGEFCNKHFIAIYGKDGTKQAKKPNTKKISDMLEAYGASLAGKAPTIAGSKDSLDIEALQKLPETIALIAKLKAIGVPSNGWLMSNGFVPAGMILRFKESKIQKCIYCKKTTDDDPHFQSACCGRGMCDECYDRLQGTDEQFQIDGIEDKKDYKRYVEGRKFTFVGDYLCFECTKNYK